MSKSKAARPEITPPSKPPEALHFPGEPERLCANCQHFKPRTDAPPKPGANVPGRCRNGISGRFESTAKDMACARGFYPCTNRFPLHERLRIAERLS